MVVVHLLFPQTFNNRSMKKIMIIGCLFLTAGNMNGQTDRRDASTGRVPVPIATAEVPAAGSGVVAIGGNASVNSVQVNAIAPEMAAQRAVPVNRPAPNHTIQMPVNGKDAPKRIRPVKQSNVK